MHTNTIKDSSTDHPSHRPSNQQTIQPTVHPTNRPSNIFPFLYILKMDIFAFIDNKNYCFLFYVLGVISFLSSIFLFLFLLYILTTKNYSELWLNVLLSSILQMISFIESYILYSMCNKLV